MTARDGSDSIPTRQACADDGRTVLPAPDELNARLGTRTAPGTRTVRYGTEARSLAAGLLPHLEAPGSPDETRGFSNYKIVVNISGAV